MSTLEDLYIRFEGSSDLDFVTVVDIYLGCGYDWHEFHAWFSPSRRSFFWASDSGCSCTTFSDGLHSLDDFENGPNRADVMAAANRFFDATYGDHSQERVDALQTINTFRMTGGSR